ELVLPQVLEDLVHDAEAEAQVLRQVVERQLAHQVHRLERQVLEDLAPDTGLVRRPGRVDHLDHHPITSAARTPILGAGDARRGLAPRGATAIISEPFEWPSSPGLPTTIRGRPPCRAPHAATRARTASTRAPSRPRRWPSTPVGGRYSPNTSRSASAHSPVVTRARAQA